MEEGSELEFYLATRAFAESFSVELKVEAISKFNNTLVEWRKERRGEEEMISYNHFVSIIISSPWILCGLHLDDYGVCAFGDVPLRSKSYGTYLAE